MLVDGVSVGRLPIGNNGASCSIKVRIVWSGRSGSHDSIQSDVGWKAPVAE